MSKEPRSLAVCEVSALERRAPWPAPLPDLLPGQRSVSSIKVARRVGGGRMGAGIGG